MQFSEHDFNNMTFFILLRSKIIQYIVLAYGHEFTLELYADK